MQRRNIYICVYVWKHITTLIAEGFRVGVTTNPTMQGINLYYMRVYGDISLHIDIYINGGRFLF